ncbi:MAG: hypothetical protein QG657_5506 [Acidobacteriota bacterium]|nr:hypothetical protein [Acidobacteriota bacterium]
MSTLFFVVAILSALWGVYNFIQIAAALEKRGIHVNMFLARIFFFRYLNQYKSITMKETGKVGHFYYAYIVAMNVALVCVLIGLILRAR